MFNLTSNFDTWTIVTCYHDTERQVGHVSIGCDSHCTQRYKSFCFVTCIHHRTNIYTKLCMNFSTYVSIIINNLNRQRTTSSTQLHSRNAILRCTQTKHNIIEVEVTNCTKVFECIVVVHNGVVVATIITTIVAIVGSAVSRLAFRLLPADACSTLFLSEHHIISIIDILLRLVHCDKVKVRIGVYVNLARVPCSPLRVRIICCNGLCRNHRIVIAWLIETIFPVTVIRLQLVSHA